MILKVSSSLYKACRIVILACLIHFSLLFTSSFALDSQNIDRYIELAKKKGLHEYRMWNVLLHYRPVNGGVESLVDDSAFFLSRYGKTDSSLELAATVKALFESAERGESHVRCLFPARSEWIASELSIPSEALAQVNCPTLDKFMDDVKPEHAVMIFPSAHNNGPASMFGHTLIRIGKKGGNDLLSFAVNYAADATDTNGLLYAFKGIFGLYPGYYSILPYYEKLKEYGDLEHRDVWEYELDLTEAEVRRMALHVWEMRDKKSDYYFFDENCSFNLLFLLEAARPDKKLVENYWDRYSFWVIPTDTISVVRNADMIKGVNYRPSLVTKIRNRAQYLSEKLQTESIIAAEDPARIKTMSAKSPEEMILVTDTASDYIQYLYSTEKISKDKFQKRFLSLLKERSKMEGSIELKAPDMPSQPETGHLPTKVTVSGGRDDRASFVDIAWQPAYHDLLDGQSGYTRGAQINFMQVSGRYYPEKSSVTLEKLKPVDIVSLASRDKYFKPVSWKVDFGVERKYVDAARRKIVGRIGSGGGLAVDFGKYITGYAFADTDVRYSDKYRDSLIAGLGGSVGALLYPLSDLAVKVETGFHRFFPYYQNEYDAEITGQYTFNKKTGLRISSSMERVYDDTKFEISA